VLHTAAIAIICADFRFLEVLFVFLSCPSLEIYSFHNMLQSTRKVTHRVNFQHTVLNLYSTMVYTMKVFVVLLLINLFNSKFENHL
jgi:hypothetical protein